MTNIMNNDKDRKDFNTVENLYYTVKLRELVKEFIDRNKDFDDLCNNEKEK